MSHPAFQSPPLRVFKSNFPQVSAAIIAIVLFGSVVALRPALAVEANDSGIFNVPGEGPPYVPEYAPRAGWPPMPARGHFRSTSESDDDLPYIPRIAPYSQRKRIYAEEPRYEDEPERDYSSASHDYGGSKGKGYGRLFPELAPRDDGEGSALIVKALLRLGRSMIEEGEPGDPAGYSETPAGYTFFGQFIDHDITLDTTTNLGREIEGDHELENARTPDLDLDSVYGGGPGRMPHLYSLPYIRVGRQISDGQTPRYDLFRTKSSRYYGPAGGESVALVGDPREDENIVISQLHAAFVAFHNRTVDILIERDFGHDRGKFCRGERSCDTHDLAVTLPDGAKARIFETARDHVIHYYHRMIAEDFLPWVIGPHHTANLLNKGRDFFFPHGFRDHDGRWHELYIPVEFAAAAFRYGHSQVGERYQVREGVELYLLSDGRDGSPRAFEPVTPRYLVDWRYFFHLDPQPPYGFNWARRIDPELVKSLHRLGRANVVGKNDLSSLAARNLLRGKTLRLPSGQQVAEEILPALEARGLLGKAGGNYRDGLWRSYLLRPDDRTAQFLGESETPLWYYVLQEAGIFGTRTYLHRAPDGEDGYLRSSGDFRHRNGERLWRHASAKSPYGAGPRHYDDGHDGIDAGHRLGPVGAAIVGEVMTGLLQHYREKTGKGLDYHPQIKGSTSYLGGSGKRYGDRYLIRNFLVDAGVAASD